MKKAEKEAMYDNIQRHGEALLELFPEARERRPIELCKSLRRLERKASDLRNSSDKYGGWLKVVRSVERLLGKDRCQYYGLFVEHSPERGPYMLKLENKTRFSQLPTDAWGCGLVAPDFSPDQQWTNQGRGREAWPGRATNPEQQRIDALRGFLSATFGPSRPAFTQPEPERRPTIVRPENIIGVNAAAPDPAFTTHQWFRYDGTSWHSSPLPHLQGEDQ
jgi:hypothetical protein